MNTNITEPKKVTVLVPYRASDGFSGSYATLTITSHFLCVLELLNAAASRLTQFDGELAEQTYGQLAVRAILVEQPLTIYNGEIDEELHQQSEDHEYPVAPGELLENGTIYLSTTSVEVYANGQVQFKAWDGECACEFELIEAISIKYLTELFEKN